MTKNKYMILGIVFLTLGIGSSMFSNTNKLLNVFSIASSLIAIMCITLMIKTSKN